MLELSGPGLDPGAYLAVALAPCDLDSPQVKITMARTVRLDIKADGVTLRWSTEALCAWLCRRNVHRLRDDFERDCPSCSCGQVQLPSEWERERLRQAYQLRQVDLAMIRMQERIRFVLSTRDIHKLWTNLS
jgi:hypothetical protein